MKNARHGFPDGVLAPPNLRLGVSEARHNRWTTVGFWLIAALLGWLIYLLLYH